MVMEMNLLKSKLRLRVHLNCKQRAWNKSRIMLKKTLDLNNDGEKFNGVIDLSEQARLFEG